MIEARGLERIEQTIRVRLECSCGQAALASHDCLDDQIIFCKHCGSITSRNKLGRSLTLPCPSQQIKWSNLRDTGECPLINISLPIEVWPKQTGPASPQPLAAQVTKISTEKSFLRLSPNQPSGVSFSTGEQIELHGSVPPLEGITCGVIEDIVYPQGKNGSAYYKIKFTDISAKRQASLQHFYQTTCGLMFEGMAVIYGLAGQSSPVRRLLSECLPMARIEVAYTPQDFEQLINRYHPDLLLMPLQMELLEILNKHAVTGCSPYVIGLLDDRTSGTAVEALALGAADNVLAIDCNFSEMRRALDHFKDHNRNHSALHVTPHPAEESPPPHMLLPKLTVGSKIDSHKDEDFVQLLCMASETHDAHSSNHLMRMSAFSAAIAHQLGWPGQRVSQLAIASRLHDVGKIGVPDVVLRKPGMLTKEERTVMEEHTRFGYNLLKHSQSPLLQLGALIALNHHERYDGNGYPQGRRGEDIPLEAQIVSVADVFDALTTARVYKAAWSIEKAIDYIKDQSGKMFNPRVVEAFLAVRSKIEQIRQQFMDDFRAVWTERRADSRYQVHPIHLDVDIVIPEQTFRPIGLEAVIRDVSQGGLKIRSFGVTQDMYALVMQSRRFLKLRGATLEGLSPKEITCELVWADYFTDPDPQACLMGLHFHNKVQGLEPMIEEWINAQRMFKP